MVVESLFSARQAHRHPVYLFFVAFVASGAGILVAHWIFPKSASLLALMFATLGLSEPFLHMMRHEENAEEKKPGATLGFFARHFRVVQALGWLFLGLVIAYAVWYAVLPADIRQSVFAEQSTTLSSINALRGELTGAAGGTPAPCGANGDCWFIAIFQNNAIVLLTGVLLSFLWVAGAVFLIAWNASILGTLIGMDMQVLLHAYANQGPFHFVPAFLAGSARLIGFLPHGIFEATAYFCGALAGGMVSLAISQHKFRTGAFARIALDALGLVLLGLIFLGIGAFIEASVIVSAVS